jgi:hypothetical protein
VNGAALKRAAPFIFIFAIKLASPADFGRAARDA